MSGNAVRERGRLRLLGVLGGLSAAAPLATDMYVPGLPALAVSLGASPSRAQVSLAGFLAGVVVGQLLFGPLSDRLGRRRVLLGGGTGFTLCSVACALAPTMEIFIGGRVLQGATGAAGLVVARAVITDTHDDRASARGFATLGAISSAAPILAPLLGGAILAFASWREVFVVQAALGTLLVAGVAAWVPESLPPRRRSRGGLTVTLGRIAGLVRRAALTRLVLGLAFGNAAVFAYIAGTSFVFTGIFGMSAALTSVVYGVNALGNLLGSVAFGRVADRVGLRVPLVGGSVAAGTATAVLVLAAAAGLAGVVVTWACLFVAITAFGVFFPAVITAAQNLGRDAPGATSALLGSSQFLIGAAASPIVGAFGETSALPMAAVMTLCLMAAVLAVCARTVGKTTA
ncbi:multidrug effflux MFS transporter [Amycolatopsis keratiniphila]|uniref:MFS transporter n=1 Tax=Amycolatopsis keratiniphila subsp. keratiniphila TaxID=227715 RepID=A0A1W2M2X5_9PSEU|nr:multidrug effflux MFS transporter [Amycolatopsis keratiniphila]ONF74396.1 MFS transporter [Amycolatopsis keratiniphila subsp. keratiniphila]